MQFMRSLLHGVLVSTCLLPLSGLATAQDASEVVSEVNGVKITRGELEQKEANRLLQVRYQTYLAESQALEDLIDQHLLEMQAAKEKITVDQLLDREVNSKVKNPTEDQLQVYYEGLGTKEPYESMKDKILDHIRQMRLAKAKTAYLQTLRTQASIVTTLAPPKADFALGDAPRQGPESAPVTLVEFADFECPYCAKVYPQLKKLREEFGDKVSIAFKNYPLPMHAHAEKAAEAARCAGDQGKYWEYHDLLFTEKQLELPQLKKYATELGLDAKSFDKCLDSGQHAAEIQKEVAEGRQLGINATPSFFINGHFFTGAADYNTLRSMVAQQLANAKPAPRQVSENK
ncbi:MAG TPA: thioredoxin domain-containing protein [Terriglobales bacterium]|nr:thioredoxin domain-containing protein [Terriglobales bacterium]